MAILQEDRVTETQRNLPIRGCYDVIVVRGGLGGVAAALTAARASGG